MNTVDLLQSCAYSSSALVLTRDVLWYDWEAWPWNRIWQSDEDDNHRYLILWDIYDDNRHPPSLNYRHLDLPYQYHLDRLEVSMICHMLNNTYFLIHSYVRSVTLLLNHKLPVLVIQCSQNLDLKSLEVYMVSSTTFEILATKFLNFSAKCISHTFKCQYAN